MEKIFILLSNCLSFRYSGLVVYYDTILDHYVLQPTNRLVFGCNAVQYILSCLSSLTTCRISIEDGVPSFVFFSL